MNIRAKAMGVDRCAYCEWHDHEEKKCKAEPGVYCMTLNDFFNKKQTKDDNDKKYK